ncbi:MAG: hypothetical protein R2752_11560 [Vicinamibacterales bacterium]
MRRLFFQTTLAATLAVAAPALLASVKTTQVDSMKFEGMLGGIINRFSGGAKDGITSTVAVNGTRMSRLEERTGQIIDLSEERVYDLDIRKKEYRVRTFAEIREEFEKARADAEKRMQEMKPEEKEEIQQAGQELEVDVDVKDMEESKDILGHTAKHMVLTVTARQKGSTLEAGGGFVMTNDLWLAPSIPELREIAEFQLKFIKAVYGEDFLADMQQMAGMMAMYPAFKGMAERMQAEGSKLQGTPLMSSSTFESVKSEEQLKAAQANQPSGGGGGIGGMLARRMTRNRQQPTARSTLFTTTHEVTSVSTTVSDADVAIPAGFKEKK